MQVDLLKVDVEGDELAGDATTPGQQHPTSSLTVTGASLFLVSSRCFAPSPAVVSRCPSAEERLRLMRTVLEGIAEADWPKVRQVALEVHDSAGRLQVGPTQNLCRAPKDLEAASCVRVRVC